MNFDPFLIVAGTMTAIAGALVGNILLMRKMVLVSDSMPHIALPGIALGVLYQFNPLLGAALFLLAAVLLIWFTEYRTKLPTESIIGVLFVTSLAVGALLIPEHELLEAFFGSIEKITRPQAIAQIVSSIIVIGCMMRNLRALVLSSVAPELAESIGIHTKLYELFFLFMVALAVAIGINFVGVLLMSALLIIPAVAARNLTQNLTNFFILSAVLGSIAMAAGLVLAGSFAVAPGILIVLVSASLFLLSLVIGPVF